jgi:uncharacterized protein (DUF1800 family)
MSLTRVIRTVTAGLLATQLLCPHGLAAQATQTAQQSMPASSSAMDGAMAQPSTHPSLPSVNASASGRPPAPSVNLRNATGPMSNDQVILHLLNRFAYGPRPGDVERVRKLGVSAWLKQQLQPETIDDSALDRRLDAYPAMKLSLDDLVVRYPNQAVVRKDMNGRDVGAPSTPAERAIYAGMEAKYREKVAGKQDAAASATVTSSAMTAPTATDKPIPEKNFNIDALLADTPQNRFKFLLSLSDDESKQLRMQLTMDERQRLMEGFTPEQKEQVAALIINPRQVVVSEIEQTKLLRDIYSERQLNEVMTDFWLNHFNVYMAKSQESPYYIADYEKNVVRPRALGYFEDLLVATAASPAMLNYLDNEESIGPHSVAAENGGGGFGKNKKAQGLNENYAREVMELHTVGVTGGYTQQDVTQLAQVFTGWTIENQNSHSVRAVFDENKHEAGSKIVMNIKVKNNGEKEGLQMLHALATNPHTAHFICQKLAVRFVSDNPSPALVDRMAAAFLKSKGDIRSVLAAMVASPEFWTSANYHSKVKTPQDYVVSALRASGADVQSAGALTTALTQLGMPFYGHQTPDGYSMKAEAWDSTAALIARLNFAFALASNRIIGVTTDWDAVLGPNAFAITPAQKESALEADLLHMPVADHTRQPILKTISGVNQQDQATLRQLVTRYQPRDPLAFALAGAAPAPLDPQAALAAGFLIGSPEFQRR